MKRPEKFGLCEIAVVMVGGGDGDGDGERAVSDIAFKAPTRVTAGRAVRYL